MYTTLFVHACHSLCILHVMCMQASILCCFYVSGLSCLGSTHVHTHTHTHVDTHAHTWTHTHTQPRVVSLWQNFNIQSNGKNMMMPQNNQEDQCIQMMPASVRSALMPYNLEMLGRLKS